MTIYSNDQISAMQSAFTAAQQANAARNWEGVLSALSNYYSAQTAVRGYAQLALEVVDNDGGSGVVANQDVANAVGQANYTTAYRANLMYQLANADFDRISSNDYQVPTLADVASDHKTVYDALQIPISSWGGTAFVALGRDFTNGLATAAELSSVTPPSFASLDPAVVQNAIVNLFVAGELNVKSLDFSDSWDFGPCEACNNSSIRTTHRTILCCS